MRRRTKRRKQPTREVRAGRPLLAKEQIEDDEDFDAAFREMMTRP